MPGRNNCQLCGRKLAKLKCETVCGESYLILKCESCEREIVRLIK